MKLLLKIKNWQLFLVLMGCLFSPSLLSSLIPPFLLKTFELAFFAIFVSWLISIGYEANRRLPDELKASQKPMMLGLIYAGIYAANFNSLVFGSGAMESLNTQFIVPFHLLAMVGIFYSLGFTAKRLMTVSIGRKVGFFEYSGPFFMFWFFPVGIWFIQPKVNLLLGVDSSELG